jgi:hypothetical protein
MSETKHVTPTDAPPQDDSVVAPPATRPPAELDEVAAAAVDLARAAADEEAPGLVGEHLGTDAEEARVVVHYFATLDPAYRGWRWAVIIARASRSKSPTVDDVVLLPGSEAILAPEWLPWSERLRPGDLGVGDLLPTAADDPRLAPSFLSTDDGEEAAVAFELGLGRERVLSFEGRLEAAERWYAGEPGPEAAMARSAPAACGTCGFFVPLAGALRQAFGACANAFAPDDAKVVAVDHGCGAHSQAIVIPVSTESAVLAELVELPADVLASELAEPELVDTELADTELADTEPVEPVAEPDAETAPVAEVVPQAEPEGAAAPVSAGDVVEPLTES